MIHKIRKMWEMLEQEYSDIRAVLLRFGISIKNKGLTLSLLIYIYMELLVKPELFNVVYIYIYNGRDILRGILLLEPCIYMRGKPTNTPIINSVY
jgi:hypothetical protein